MAGKCPGWSGAATQSPFPLKAAEVAVAGDIWLCFCGVEGGGGVSTAQCDAFTAALELPPQECHLPRHFGDLLVRSHEQYDIDLSTFANCSSGLPLVV